MKLWLVQAYKLLILRSPLITLSVLAVLALSIIRYAPQFELDASADSLTLENDRDVAYYREIRKVFPSSDDFLVIAFTPKGELFSPDTINVLKRLKNELLSVPSVQKVNSLLDVPLLNDPDMTLTNVSDHLESIEQSGDVDLQSARTAMLANPLYRNLLLSEDGETAALQLILKSDPRYRDALRERNDLRAKRRQASLTHEEKIRLEALEVEVKNLNQKAIEEHKDAVQNIRNVMSHYENHGAFFLGGIPMIVVDMLDYVRNDIRVFGLGVAIFLVLTLAVIFRRTLWVILPMFCCTLVCLIMVGYLGYLRFPVTVISSNFISLLLIITMSMIIHLIVRYRELSSQNPQAPPKVLALDTVKVMALPCLYTSLTTVVAFASLLVSGIRPVIDFGIMMSVGIGFAYAVVFLLFPVILAVMPKETVQAGTFQALPVSVYLARFTEKYNHKLVIAALLTGVLCVVGISRLSVENRFIDYFKESTEIYQGMRVIDNKLGGTTPLDIIIDTNVQNMPAEETPEDCFIDDECLENVHSESTLFTRQRMNDFEKIHDFLAALPEAGKVLSLVTTIRVAEKIKGGPLDSLELAFLNSMFPQEMRRMLLDPFVNEESGQVRFTLRVLESDPDLKRQALLDKIRSYLVNDMQLNPNDIHFTSMVVLYNNMLQSLFRSQIATIGVVFIGIMLMFVVLFRSLFLAMIGIIPNILAAVFVLGLMGWLGVPLDMMTITIAAISVGIAVDNTIHYIYRYKTEFAKDRNYRQAMYRSHATIGRAVYYTSITIIFGFSILTLSNFNPTVYFGLFTGVAMFMALLSSLTLLPELIIMFKPLGPDNTMLGTGTLHQSDHSESLISKSSRVG